MWVQGGIKRKFGLFIELIMLIGHRREAIKLAFQAR